MFEIPEILTLSRQINETLAGKVIQRGVWATHRINSSGTIAVRRSLPP